MILTDDKKLARKFNSAIFPGMQGGPLMHVIAGKAVAFGDALKPEFKAYSQRVIDNCQAMAAAMVEGGYAVVSGGTDTHLALIDLSPKGVKGNAPKRRSDGLISPATRTAFLSTKRSSPSPPASASAHPQAQRAASALRSSARLGQLMVEVLDALAENPEGNPEVEASVKERVVALTFPDLCRCLCGLNTNVIPGLTRDRPSLL